MHSFTDNNVHDGNKKDWSMKELGDLFSPPTEEALSCILNFAPIFVKCLEDDIIYDEKASNCYENDRFITISLFIAKYDILQKRMYPILVQPELLNQKIYTYLQRVFSSFRFKQHRHSTTILNSCVSMVISRLSESATFQVCLTSIITFLEQQKTYDSYAWIVSLCFSIYPIASLFSRDAKREALDAICRTVVSADHPHQALWFDRFAYYIWIRMSPIETTVRPRF